MVSVDSAFFPLFPPSADPGGWELLRGPPGSAARRGRPGSAL